MPVRAGARLQRRLGVVPREFEVLDARLAAGVIDRTHQNNQRTECNRADDKAKSQRFGCEIAGRCARRERSKHRSPIKKLSACRINGVNGERSFADIPERENQNESQSEYGRAGVETDTGFVR